jgi:hypothetical protein
MSLASEPEPVLPVVSVLQPAGASLATVQAELEKFFGPVLAASDPYPFELTDYYRDEMGEGLQRIWLAFGRLAGAEHLPDWKLECSSLERELSGGDSRVYNLDPGYVDHGKLVLASFKGAPDKLYMGRGVFAHTCLRFRFGGFEAPDHSFPDFSDGRYDGFMLQLRQLYKSTLRELRSGADSGS